MKYRLLITTATVFLLQLYCARSENDRLEWLNAIKRNAEAAARRAMGSQVITPAATKARSLSNCSTSSGSAKGSGFLGLGKLFSKKSAGDLVSAGA